MNESILVKQPTSDRAHLQNISKTVIFTRDTCKITEEVTMDAQSLCWFCHVAAHLLVVLMNESILVEPPTCKTTEEVIIRSTLNILKDF